MKLFNKLFWIGSMLLLGTVVFGARRRRVPDRPEVLGTRPENGAQDTVGLVTENADAAEIPPGIADVDPQPLTQIAGEAIDPEATQAAHETILDQRAKLPTTSKRIP